MTLTDDSSSLYCEEFEKLCALSAVSKAHGREQTIRQMIAEVFVLYPEDSFTSTKDISEYIANTFSLPIPENEISPIVDAMEEDEVLLRPHGTNYLLEPNFRSKLEESNNEARSLEDRVKQQWLESIVSDYPMLPIEEMWPALKVYLKTAFRRHGFQAAALLDPTIDTGSTYSDSLSSMLTKVIREHFSQEHQESARDVIAKFLADTGKYPDRSLYIAQLADAVFNLCTVTIDPHTTNIVRENIEELTLFLDTNFLFGILNLHVNPQVSVSNDLLRLTSQHRFPFQLKYHEATKAELLASIEYHKRSISGVHWSREMSRIATLSRNIDGVALRFHQCNAEVGTDVDSFFAPYRHIDLLLDGHNITIHRSSICWGEEQIQLLRDYERYFEEQQWELKSEKTMQHDVIVLDMVRRLRTTAPSSLSAGALLMTCDYKLFRFDWWLSRREDRRPCTVLPHAFWQVLRSITPLDDMDFDKAFAETFAIPEFRAIGSGAARATSKMMKILAGYRPVPENAAMRMVANDIFIDSLRAIEDEAEFQQAVDNELARQNSLLGEEYEALREQNRKERAEREAEAARAEAVLAESERKRLESEKNEAATIEELRTASKAAEEAETRRQRELAEAEEKRQRELAEAEEKLQQELAAAEEKRQRELADATNQTRIISERLTTAEMRQRGFIAALLSIIGTVGLWFLFSKLSNWPWFEEFHYRDIFKVAAWGALLITICEKAIRWIPWRWLIVHKHSFGIRFALCLVILQSVISCVYFDKPIVWGVSAAVLALFGIVAQLLGGPKNS